MGIQLPSGLLVYVDIHSRSEMTKLKEVKYLQKQPMYLIMS